MSDVNLAHLFRPGSSPWVLSSTKLWLPGTVWDSLASWGPGLGLVGSGASGLPRPGAAPGGRGSGWCHGGSVAEAGSCGPAQGGPGRASAWPCPCIVGLEGPRTQGLRSPGGRVVGGPVLWAEEGPQDGHEGSSGLQEGLRGGQAGQRALSGLLHPITGAEAGVLRSPWPPLLLILRGLCPAPARLCEVAPPSGQRDLRGSDGPGREGVAAGGLEQGPELRLRT